MYRTMFTFLLLVFTSFVLVDDSRAETCGRIADVVFVIDSSRSIWPPYFRQQLEFVKQVVKAFDVGQGKTRIGALTFSDRTISEFHLHKYDNKQDILDAISAINFAQGSATNTFDALRVLRTEFFSEKNGDRPDVPNIAIVLTDGESSNTASTVHEADLTKKAGIAIFAIGIGSKVNKVELEEIASLPKSDYMHILENFKELQSDAFTKLLSHKACTAPLTTPTTTTTPKTTTTTITTTTTTEAAEISTKMQQEEAERACQGKPADIIFVLDVSSSIWFKDFKTQMNFVKDIVDIFDINSGKAQVGIITFSDYAEVEFRLGQHKTKKTLMEAIDMVEYRGGSTNTSHALMLLRGLFRPGSGSRQGVAHIAIVITDGLSQDPQATQDMAKLSHDEGIYVFAIGVGNNSDIQELQAIASEPSEQYMYQVNGYNALRSIQSILAYKACEVQADVFDDSTSSTACTTKTDTEVVFAVDEFGGKDKKNVMLFIQKVGGGFDLDSGHVRVGVMHKCSANNIELGQYSTKDLFVEAIEASMTGNKVVPFLKEIRQKGMYDARSGARKKLVLLVSDTFTDWEEAAMEINRLKFKTEVNVIGVGDRVSRNQLQQLASSQSNIFMVEDTAKLQDIALKIHKLLCSS